MKNAVCIIPARGGSQRIPRKNIRLFHGKPIIAYSIETAQKSGLFDAIYVSTEDEEIADISKKYGASVLRRPVHLADHLTGTQEVMAYELRKLGIPCAGMACCLYPTAPLLSPATLKRASDPSLLTYAHYVVPIANWLNDPGQFYMGEVGSFRDQMPLFSCTFLRIPKSTDCDINTEEDWIRAEKMYANLKGLQ